MEVRTLTAIGAVMLALCGLPQAYRGLVEPASTRELSSWFLWAWCLGEVFMLLGMIPVASWPVLANYLGNFTLTLFLIGTKRWRA